MDQNILIALLCGLVNMALSIVMPCMLKKTKDPLMSGFKKVFDTNREVIVVSSLIVAITAYLALSLYPMISTELDSDNVRVYNMNDNAGMSRSVMMQLLGKDYK